MAANNQQPSRILLPRRLVRPIIRAIDPRAVAAIDPLLETIPLSYIQHSLKDLGPQLLRAICNATAIPPTGKLPRELRVVCNDVSVDPPSHIIAACHPVSTRVALFPVHAIIMATSCANLPMLPRSKPDTPSTAGGSVILPIIPIRIPSPASFPTLLSYLYTARTDRLLTELLPASNTTSVPQLVRAHANTLPVKTLMDQVRKTYGVWSNTVTLGIFDDRLFRVLEMAWEVLLGALAMRSGRSMEAGVDVDGELE